MNYIVPSRSSFYNPGDNADAEAMVKPGTGQIEAIAEDRPYGTNWGQTEIDYAVNTEYGGSSGVQTGSSSKLFTLITALNQGIPFGYTQIRSWQHHPHRLHRLPRRPGRLLQRHPRAPTT